MTALTRRQSLGLFAGAAISPAGFADFTPIVAEPQPSVLETQEQKCARLLHELMAECQKLELKERNNFGLFSDIQLERGQTARYSVNEKHGQMLWVDFEKGAA